MIVRIRSHDHIHDNHSEHCLAHSKGYIIVSSIDHPASKSSLNICPYAKVCNTCFMYNLVHSFIQ